jgi:CubicO group peptidase (beta-lactamase class C family)
MVLPQSKELLMKRTHLTMLAVLALISALSTVAAGASVGSRAAAIDDLMSKYAALGSFSGAILVADRDGIVIKKAYGLANREWDIPNTTDTRFRIGSLSKQFTAALVMILCEEGRLSLDAKLGDVLPW